MTPDRDAFRRLAEGANAIPLVHALMSDQLTPVLGYRRLVAPDERTAPSFLFESVEGGASIGRYSFIGAQPSVEVVARGHTARVTDRRKGEIREAERANPLESVRELTAALRPAPVSAVAPPGFAMPSFSGGWVGYAGYDVARYLEPEKLPFASAPSDDRGLPDLHFGLYPQIGIFDHARKVLFAVQNVFLEDHASVDEAYEAGSASLAAFVERLRTPGPALAAGAVDLDLSRRSPAPILSNFAPAEFEAIVERAKEYITAGDAFQIVLSQRFERRTPADPFEIYRALRIVNPSPYMIYLQAEGSILVASSPEILCRAEGRDVVNRPLAGTRRRGASPEEDRVLEAELKADEKECSEHVMLVDLGRNDLGRVCEMASIRIPRMMEVERYSHVMHLSSTVTGRLQPMYDCWDALIRTLPVGTVSGAPKVRAMQIIDELETVKRGPYAGGIGYVGFEGDMDMAIALRTLVIPGASDTGGTWTVHLQAGAGVVADSVPTSEHEETVHKAAALSRAIDLAEAEREARHGDSAIRAH